MKKIALLLIVITASVLVVVAMRLGPVAAGYKAKTMCSGLFVSRRTEAQLNKEELKVDEQPILHLVDTQIDYENKRVDAHFLHLIKRSAQFRNGLGCTLAIKHTPEELLDQAQGFPNPHPTPSNQGVWPNGDRISKRESNSPLEQIKLQQAADHAFVETEPQTRAVVIVHRGKIIFERYAAGIEPNAPLQGWSMTKSVLNALIGIMSAEQGITVNTPLPQSIWPAPDPQQQQITYDHLLRMTSGLKWREGYINPFSDVITISWGSGDRANFMAQRAVTHQPGTHWQYSTGSSFLLSAALRKQLKQSLQGYWAYPQQRLFSKIGMQTAIFEPDESGTLGGGGFMYASPRDWARLGVLYLNDGIWMGERILPQGWVEYTTTLTKQSQGDRYLAHFWQRIPHPYYNRNGDRPSLPDDAYHMVGHWGQFVSIIPSKQLVVVRMGLTMEPWSWDHEQFLAELLEAL